jgi:DNA polymerase III delta subunit
VSTYAQWRAAADRGELRRVTWVCGDQPVLIEEVIDAIRAQLAITDLNFASFTAAETPDRQIWAAALQHPLTPGAPRLVLVREVQRVQHWEQLGIFIAAYRELATNHLLLVASEPDVPTAGGKRTPEAVRHIELIRAKGRIVRCAMPNETDLLAWVARRAPAMDHEMIRYLLTRTGGNLAAVAAACAKISLLPGNPGTNTIDALTTPSAGESFVDALLSGEKPTALRAATGLSEHDALAAIGLLDNRLDLLAALWRATRAGLSAREITGIPVFLVRRWQPHAKHYDPRRCVYARRVLSVADSALRNGARGGVLEALVALW